jgi:hypothetical protein
MEREMSDQVRNELVPYGSYLKLSDPLTVSFISPVSQHSEITCFSPKNLDALPKRQCL